MVSGLARTFEGVYSNVQELARAIGKDMAYVSRITRLTLLSPEIIHGVLTGSWTKSAWKSASSLFPFYGMNRKSFSVSSNATQLLAVGIILPPFLFLLIVFLLCEVIL